jgi:hypothetical protein
LKKVPYTLSIISGLGLGMVPPIFPVFIQLLFYKIEFLKKNFIIFLILLLIGLIIFSYSGNIKVIYNLGIIGIIILYKSKIINDHSIYSLSPVIIYFTISLLLGFGTPQIPEEPRLRFYGGEINFTAFYILILSLIFFERQSIFYGYSILVISFIITLSRGAFFTAIIIILLRINNKNNKLYFVLFVIFISFLLFFIFRYTDLVLETSGYAMGIERLLIIEDASSMSRLYLNQIYGNLLISDINYLFFGLPNNVLNSFINYNELSNVVHNSYIYKTLDVGLPTTLGVIISGFMILPKNVMYIILIYSFVLHSLLSPALFLLLSFYIKKNH